jgi:hypothetical protein
VADRHARRVSGQKHRDANPDLFFVHGERIEQMSRQVNRDVIALWCGRVHYLAVRAGETQSPQGSMVLLQGRNGFDSTWMRRYFANTLLDVAREPPKKRSSGD